MIPDMIHQEGGRSVDEGLRKALEGAVERWAGAWEAVGALSKECAEIRAVLEMKEAKLSQAEAEEAKERANVESCVEGLEDTEENRDAVSQVLSEKAGKAFFKGVVL